MGNYLIPGSREFQEAFQASLDAKSKHESTPALDEKVTKHIRNVLLALRAYQAHHRDHKKLKELLLCLDAFLNKRPKFFAAHPVLTELYDQSLVEESKKQSLKKHVAALTSDWASVNVTDIPIKGNPGKYTFTPENAISESDRTLALIHLGFGRNKETTPEYWLTLGYLMHKRTEKYGRCFSCAAYAIFCLVAAPELDDILIEHVGAKNFDHHLLLLDRTNADGSSNAGLNSHELWQDAYVIDVWQGNLDAADQLPRAYLQSAKDHRYAKSDLKLFATFPPSKRIEHRRFAQRLSDTDLMPKNIVLEKLAAARAAEAHRI
jgi:hypothetical protein